MNGSVPGPARGSPTNEECCDIFLLLGGGRLMELGRDGLSCRHVARRSVERH